MKTRHKTHKINKEHNKDLIGGYQGRSYSSRRRKKVSDSRFMLPLTLLFVGLLFFTGIYNNLRADIMVNGHEKLTVEVNNQYQEQGASASYKGNELAENKKIEVAGKVDTGKTGEYVLIYSVKHNGVTSKVKRVVEVVDTQAPIISLEGETKLNICPKDDFKDPGFKCLDNYDGDITDKVEVKVKKDKVIYTVKDQSGNKSQIERNLNRKDEVSPELGLLGPKTLYISVNSQYKDPGYEVYDDFDKDLKDKVKVSGQVDASKLGEYVLKYEVADCSGNKSGAERKVIVTDQPLPQGQNSTIYLTFDDGNSSKTIQILDILKKEKVKATFFVVGTNLKHDIMKRIVAEGHAIGLHSDTHKYEQIYSSTSAFFNDIETLSNKIKEMTGVETKILRFPGGSSNAVSKSYTPGIMSVLVNEVHAKGYHYFDWNVGSADSTSITGDQIYQNIVSGLGVKETYVTLFHDIEKNQATVDALPKIIEYGKSHGYQFDKITMTTPEFHHGVTN